MKKLKEIHGHFLEACGEEDESDYAKEKRRTFQAIQEVFTKTSQRDGPKEESTSSNSTQPRQGNEELSEKWNEEKITEVMKDQDHSMIGGIAEKGTWPTSSDIEVQLTK